MNQNPILRNISMSAHALDLPTLISDIEELSRERSDKPGWVAACERSIDWLNDMNLTPPHQIMSPDNTKLNFWNFSTLPGEKNCPGAGQCLEICFSFKAQRYPDAFFRQVLNTVMIRHRDGPLSHLTNAFLSLPYGSRFRLYCDGDFDSVETVMYWMSLIGRRKDLDTFCYSKSWLELLAADELMKGQWPDNFVLNESSGSMHGEDVAKQIRKLPIYRGPFSYVKVSNHGLERYDKMEYKREVISVARSEGLKGKLFCCPGKCGKCTSEGPLCALPEMKGIHVVIGGH